MHLLVTAGGLSFDGSAWIKPAHPRFLIPGYSLSEIFRAKMHDALRRAALDRDLDPRVWKRSWTVHIQQIGTGEQAILYLSRYVYRVALTNQRIERFEHGGVTFRYTHARTHETRRATIPVDVFIGRFLQHVLPRGFTKIRSYGLLSPSGRADLERARHLLHLHAPEPVRHRTDAAAAPSLTSTGRDSDSSDTVRKHTSATDGITMTRSPVTTSPQRCPVCQRGQLRFVECYRRSRAPPS